MGRTTNMTQQATETQRVYRIVLIGLFAALAMILMTIRFAPMPSAGFLKYDLGDIPILLLALLAGPIPSLLALLLSTLVEMVTIGQDGFWGFFMHFIATGSMVVALSAVTHKSKSTLRVILGLLLAGVVLVAVMIPMNLLITPIFTGAPREAVVKMIMPILLPFNALKGGLHAVITFLLFKAIAPVFHTVSKKFTTHHHSA